MKNEIVPYNRASSAVYMSSNSSIPFTSISTNDTYSITPAEKPREAERNFGLKFFEKNIKKLHIPVDIPAKIVKLNANQKLLSIKTCKIIKNTLNVSIIKYFYYLQRKK